MSYWTSTPERRLQRIGQLEGYSSRFPAELDPLGIYGGVRGSLVLARRRELNTLKAGGEPSALTSLVNLDWTYQGNTDLNAPGGQGFDAFGLAILAAILIFRSRK